MGNRNRSDPEPKPCALLLKIMAEEFPEHDKNGAGEISIKVEGIAPKTEVETDETPDHTEIQAGHSGKVKDRGKEVKTENILDIKRVQRSSNIVSQTDCHKRSTDNRFNPYSARRYGYGGSRAGCGGYGSDRKRGSSSAGHYANTRPTTGYGGY